ncbi:ecto-ADP-ribosyltransferase 5-like isoform X2 [Ascaphus truei]|uniref:ecto-ADP-ribosyltransferase 5-like isoform X2 n=1 Tax=Ascaphus truei TaxID=8439 RepID=UPI003F5A872E
MTLLFIACITLCPDFVGNATVLQNDSLEHRVSDTSSHTEQNQSADSATRRFTPCAASGDADYCGAYKDKASDSEVYRIKDIGSSVKQETSSRRVHLWPKMECNMVNLDLVPNAFDDQYKGCTEKLEADIMPKVLKTEKSFNPEFGSAWDRAASQWNKIKATVRLPGGFKDAYGIAIGVYTTEWPKGKPVYQPFNGNVSTAGKSRDYYMQNFHFKALHFYLTRALQVLKANSRVKHHTYRGTDASYEVSEAAFRFGRFTSSSLNIEVAKEYCAGLFFELTTCFGVAIHRLSSFPKEREVLIPVAEKFYYVGRKGNVHVLNSTCELCSYFNCAYLGGKCKTGGDPRLTLM